MKIQTILLRDSGDYFYTDLITFKRYTTKKELYEIIKKCKVERENYTNEDIYEYLDKYIGIEKLVFLGDYDTIDY